MSVSEPINLGGSRSAPLPESALLDEEKLGAVAGSRLSRLLMSFEILVDTKSVSLTKNQIRSHRYKGVQVIGAVGTLKGRSGLFAQACWFGTRQLDWKWMRLEDIEKIEIKNDPSFRQGVSCFWLSTKVGDYAMAVPGRAYRDQWEQTLRSLGQEARQAVVEMWPRSGTRPAWWDKQWENDWPFAKETTDATLDNEFSAIVLTQDETSRSEGQPNQPIRPQWARLGPSAGHTTEEVGFIPPSLLHQRTPWELRKDGGLLKDHEPQGVKRKADLLDSQ